MINIHMGDVFKAVGSFLSKNWQTIALLIMIILFFATKNDYYTLQKSMDVMDQSYKDQIAALEALHSEEIKKREEALEEYEKEVLELTNLYEEALEEIKRGSEKDIADFIRDFVLQPEKLANDIVEEFGFKYVE